MQINCKEKAILISTICSAVIFAVFFLLVFFGEISAGRFPLWVSISGAVLMCYLPVKLAKDGELTVAMWLSSIVLFASIGHALIAVDELGLGPVWLHVFLQS